MVMDKAEVWLMYGAGKARDRALRWAAWHLPHRIVMWCGYRIIAHATSGEYSNQVVPELTAMDAMNRWGE